MAYSDIKDPSAYFTTTLWTGAGGSPRAITNDANSGNFQPDFIWTKGRNEAYEHILYDSSRGTGTTKGLCSNDTSAEGTISAAYGYLSSFDSNGFTGTAGSSGQNAYFDTNAKTYVAWQWKANGGTTSTNTDGSINTTVQSNSTAGFNIITYTGTGGGETLGHGLGVAPDMWIVKRRSGTGSWAVGFNDSSILGGTSNYLILQSSGATATYNNFWGSSPANSNVMRIAGDNTIGGSGSTYVAYAFAEKQGYSKFGKYVGNGSTNGPFVYTGFKPALIITKNADATDSWNLLDNKRSPYNAADKYLQADNGNAEGTYTFYDILSNGFKIRNTGNANILNNDIIYMAFAENPFVAGGVPTTAR